VPVVRGERRQTPVEDVDLVEESEQDVAGLEVAVDHAARVRVADDVADLRERGQRTRQLAAARRGARAVEHLAQLAALDERHRVVEPAALVESQVVHGDHAGMPELRRDRALAQEARDRLVAAGLAARGLQLHRQRPVQQAVPDLHDEGHAALRDLAATPVARGARPARASQLGQAGLRAARQLDGLRAGLAGRGSPCASCRAGLRRRRGRDALDHDALLEALLGGAEPVPDASDELGQRHGRGQHVLRLREDLDGAPARAARG
jgi:hypothetical protein